MRVCGREFIFRIYLQISLPLFLQWNAHSTRTNRNIYDAIKYSFLREYLIKTFRKADPKPPTHTTRYDPLENYEIFIVLSQLRKFSLLVVLLKAEDPNRDFVWGRRLCRRMCIILCPLNLNKSPQRKVNIVCVWGSRIIWLLKWESFGIEWGVQLLWGWKLTAEQVQETHFLPLYCH